MEQDRDFRRANRQRPAQTEPAKIRLVADLGDGDRADASENESAPSWTRTKNLLIKSPPVRLENTEENGDSRECGGSSGGTQNEIDADLAAIIDAWPALPEAIKAGISAMVNAARRDGAEG